MTLRQCSAPLDRYLRAVPQTGSGFARSNNVSAPNCLLALQLIAKYWKYNLFSGDHLLNRLPTPQHTTFTTSFGVTFGTFVCFDLTYRDPAVALVDEGITDFVFSTYWINGHVFTATAIQQAFSRAQNVNLIASNVGVCTSNCGGGKHALSSTLLDRLS